MARRTSLVVRTATRDESLLAVDQDDVRDTVRRTGSILLRGWSSSVTELEEMCLALFDSPLIYGGTRERISRSDVIQSAEPGSQRIDLHSENTFAPSRPDLAVFCCRVAPEAGGSTMISDGVSVLADLRPEARRAFEGRRVRYRTALSAPAWQRVFQTTSRERMERIARAIQSALRDTPDEALAFELDGEDTVLLEYLTPAVIGGVRGGPLAAYASGCCTLGHPHTPPDRPIQLLPGKLRSTDVAFEDGSPISDALRAEVRDVSWGCALAIDWQPGDVVVIDNWSVMHGREAFDGPREVHAAFGYAEWIRPPGRVGPPAPVPS